MLLYWIVLGVFVITTIVFIDLFVRTKIALRRVYKQSQESQSLPTIVKNDVDFNNHDSKEGPDQELLMKIKEAFEVDKVYLDSTLTISSLAEKLGTSKHALSRVINENLGVNFPTLLNGYRVDEALRLFNDPTYDNLTIDAIAEKSGYNSRQVLHSAFKKKLGVTPKRFRQK